MANNSPMGSTEDEGNPEKGWWKSSYSQSNGHCVEVARFADGRMGVRDSKVDNGPVLHFSATAWTVFLGEVRAAQSPRQRS